MGGQHNPMPRYNRADNPKAISHSTPEETVEISFTNEQNS